MLTFYINHATVRRMVKWCEQNPVKAALWLAAAIILWGCLS